MTPVPRTWLALMLGLGLVACSGAAAGEPEQAGRWQLGNRALERTLVVGTLIQATLDSSLSWSRSKPGDALTATVSTDVRNANRWIVIPAGCMVGLRISLLGSDANRSHEAPKLLLDVTSVTVWGQTYPLSATVEVTRAAVVPPGTRILFVLPEGLTVERRFKDASLQIASSFDARPIGAPAHNC
jgi:hypothetical protein